jgi:hypothetical protein
MPVPAAAPPAPALSARSATTWTDLLATLAFAAFVVLGFLSFHVPGRDPGPLSPARIKKEYVTDPAIHGIGEAVTRAGDGVAISGWALDTAHPGSPLSLYVFGARGRLVGSAVASQGRTDVDQAFGGSFGPTGFVIVTMRDCPPGQRLKLFAVSNDGRFARLAPHGGALACP